MDFSALMPESTLSDIESRARTEAARAPMDEEAFRAFYDRTSRPIWVYLTRLTSDPRIADDLLQETYYRFYRAGGSHDSESHRRNYLYQIATNLVRDRARRVRGTVHVPLPDSDSGGEIAGDTGAAKRVERSADLARAMERLDPVQREMLWLAYAEGSSHDEIAETLGMKAGNVRTLLLRARRKLARLLGAQTEPPKRGGRHG